MKSILVAVLAIRHGTTESPTVSPAMKYKYVYGSWSACVRCQRSRSVRCFDVAREAPVDDMLCADNEPISVETCCTMSPTTVSRRHVVLLSYFFVSHFFSGLGLLLLCCLAVYAAAIAYRVLSKLSTRKIEDTKYSRILGWDCHEPNHQTIELRRGSSGGAAINTTAAGEENHSHKFSSHEESSYSSHSPLIGDEDDEQYQRSLSSRRRRQSQTSHTFPI